MNQTAIEELLPFSIKLPFPRSGDIIPFMPTYRISIPEITEIDAESEQDVLKLFCDLLSDGVEDLGVVIEVAAIPRCCLQKPKGD